MSHGIIHSVRQLVAYSRMLREFRALTNEQLRALGIDRADIPRIARELARALKP